MMMRKNKFGCHFGSHLRTKMSLVQLRGGMRVVVMSVFPLVKGVSQHTLTGSYQATKYPCNRRSALLWISAVLAFNEISAVLAFNEISAYRECRGRFGQRVARLSAERMSPTEWWFQFGGEVPNLQKYALRIVSQCVSSSGCERNWSAFALVHTQQRNRLLYGKLHKCVSVRYNLKIRAEEDQDPVRENAKEKEVDPCAMMMDAAMFDKTNPMMEWLNEDEEHIILDGAEAAAAVFEKIRFLNSSKKATHLGRKNSSRKRTRDVEEVEEVDDYSDSEDDDQENGSMGIDDDDDGQDDDGHSDGEDSPRQVENEIDVLSDGNLASRRSGRVRQTKKIRDITSLYK
uniref:Uncharacterized protein n=4 Tax=Avena sativa TaxID=4498 RepID=A0ACD6A9T0_AVESA